MLLCSVVFGVMLRLLVINTSSSSPAINKVRRLPATSVVNLPWSATAECIALVGLIPFRARDGARFWLKIENFLPTPPAFDAPVRRSPSEYCHNVWYGKTRMMWLADGENVLKICLFISTEYTNVTDGRTDRHRATIGHASA